MAALLNGSSQYFSAASTLLTNEPIDMIAHGNPSTTDNQSTVALGNNGASGNFETLITSGALIQSFKQQDDTPSAVASTTTNYSIDTWQVGSTSFISNSSRAVYIDGGSKGTNASSVADPTPDFISIGALRRSSIIRYFNGSLAEAYILDINQSDAQHAARGQGYSALWDVPIKNVRGWYPLLRALGRNRMAGGYPDLTPTGSPTVSAHPPNVVHPRIGALMTF